MNSILYNVIRKPHTTEKSMRESDKFNKFVFQVDKKSTKKQVAKAIREIFKVEVTSVNISNVKGKTKRFRQTLGNRPSWKKAIVTLAKGNDINLAEFM